VSRRCAGAPGRPTDKQGADFRWHPATPANLARLEVTVPPGFKQVPAPTPAAAHAP
jgi:hypothetical protein